MQQSYCVLLKTRLALVADPPEAALMAPPHCAAGYLASLHCMCHVPRELGCMTLARLPDPADPIRSASGALSAEVSVERATQRPPHLVSPPARCARLSEVRSESPSSARHTEGRAHGGRRLRRRPQAQSPSPSVPGYTDKTLYIFDGDWLW